MLESYYWQDLIYPISFFIAFLASAPWGRKAWLIVECSASFAFGIGLILIPDIVLGFQITGGKLDIVHAYLARQIGAVLVGQAISLFLCKNSFDSRMYGSVFYSRIFSSLLLLIGQCYSAYHLSNRKGMHFNEQFLSFGCCGVCFWTLGSLIQILRYKEIGGYIHKSAYSTAGFYMDHFVLLLSSVILFAFPTPILQIMIKHKPIDGVHVCLVRNIAAFLIGHALTSNAAPGFLYIRDQKMHLIGRLTTHILVFSNNIYGQFVSDIFTLHHVTPFMITGFYITFLLTLIFRFNDDRAMGTIAKKFGSLSQSSMTKTASQEESDHKVSKREFSLDDIDRSSEEGEFEGRLIDSGIGNSNHTQSTPVKKKARKRKANDTPVSG